jgi:hypothetical protein
MHKNKYYIIQHKNKYYIIQYQYEHANKIKLTRSKGVSYVAAKIQTQ